jgi:histidine triad (HIT) family protein
VSLVALACCVPTIVGRDRECRAPVVRPQAHHRICLDQRMNDGCTFCRIVAKLDPADIFWEDDLTLAFIDLRQFHAGHSLVIPRAHFEDVRGLDPATGAALMSALSHVAAAVGATFPNQGLSLWHSVGEAAFQEVPHLHFHVHPRKLGDNLLRIYPSWAQEPDEAVRESYAELLRNYLARSSKQRLETGSRPPS